MVTKRGMVGWTWTSGCVCICCAGHLKMYFFAFGFLLLDKPRHVDGVSSDGQGEASWLVSI